MTTCFHLDMGGERAPWAQLLLECQGKQNTVSYSHWDWDHLSFTAEAQRRFSSLCLSHPPPGEKPLSLSKVSMIARLPVCWSLKTPWREIHFPPGRHPRRDANASSRVLTLSDGALIPGDSPTTQERRWAPFLFSPQGRPLRLLVLGHHGSKSSTSAELLKNLPQLRQAWVSARRRRYGHPHRQVVERLKKQRVPLLRTEDWGTLKWLL